MVWICIDSCVHVGEELLGVGPRQVPEQGQEVVGKDEYRALRAGN